MMSEKPQFGQHIAAPPITPADAAMILGLRPFLVRAAWLAGRVRFDHKDGRLRLHLEDLRRAAR
jgi:hypothetical protein